MSALSGSSRRALSAAASSSARRLHTQQPLSATAAPGAAGSPSAGAGYGAHAAGEQHEEHAHKLFNPPYGKLAPISILAFCVFGAASTIGGAIAYQQKKGGFWFKKKSADK